MFVPMPEASSEEAGRVLREAADWYYNACELYEDDDLDPDDHLAVIERAFTSSECDAFAHVLALVTGWPFVRANWVIDGVGFGHHALVRAPDGRLLDITGFTDVHALSRRTAARVTLTPERPTQTGFGHEVEAGIDADLARILTLVRCLPTLPFSEPWFKALSHRPIVGADTPDPSLL